MLNQRLYEYIFDVENPETNYNLAIEYKKIGQTASAISFFLRCADRCGKNLDLAYECLIHIGECFDMQGNRTAHSYGAFKQAITILPKRPEAYYYICRLKNWHSLYEDGYEHSLLALDICNFDDNIPLRNLPNYRGKFCLLFEKALSSWWWGKYELCRNTFLELCENHWDEMNQYEKNTTTKYLKEHYNIDVNQVVKQKQIPVIGVPIVNGTKWLKRLIESIDYPVKNLLIINNNGRGEIDEDLNQIRNTLLAALVVRYIDARDDLWLAGGCAIAALIAVGSALILLPGTTRRAAMAVLTAAGTVPVLAVGLTVDRVAAALMAAALSAAMLAIVLAGDRLPGVPGAARQVFSAWSAVAALVAVTVAFDGRVAGPVLLALAVVVAVAGRHDTTARWAAFGFTIVGTGVHLSYSPLFTLLEPVKTGAAAGVSTLVSSVLLASSAVAVLWSWRSREAALWVVAGGVVVYSVTSFTVTAGTMIAGDSAGFYGGHMVATICWIVLAAALFGYAARRSRAERSVPIGAGLALVAAAVAKLFLFDLGTLDGIFRVVVFIVVGLILLGMGAGYARLLDKQDRQDHENAVDVTTDTG